MEMLTTHNAIKRIIISDNAVADKMMLNYMVHVSRGRPAIYAALFLLILYAHELAAPKFLFFVVLAHVVVLTMQTSYAKHAVATPVATISPSSKRPPLMNGFAFLSLMSGALWGVTMYPVASLLGENVTAAVLCATVLISVSLTVAMKAGQPRFVRAYLAGFALFQIPQGLYFRDSLGWIPTIAILVLVGTLVWMAEIIRRQASAAIRAQMENEILADQLSDALARATYFSQRDSLTGLLNRRAFEEAAFEIKAKAGRDANHAIILIDLDHFKSINDRYGHALGDDVLKTVAAIINKSIGPCDLVGRGDGAVARWGGEEFVVLLNDCQPAQALCDAESICFALASSRKDDWPDDMIVTGSLGVASWSGSATLQSAVSNADQAMYTAKRAGRNQVCVYSTSQY